jgi:hypothetical protein
MPKHWCLIPAAAALAGCIPAPESEPATSSTSANICGFLCGDNGGLIDGIPFFGAYLPGAPIVGKSDPRVLRFESSFSNMKLGIYAPIDVDGGRLRTRIAGNWRYGPAVLENGVLLIAVGLETYFVKIANVNSGTVGGMNLGEPFWTTMPGDRAETYQLQWAASDAPMNPSGEPLFQDVCPNIVELDGDQWQNQIDAVVFEGEKYNLETTKISLTPTGDYVAWFNVACAGSLPAKMYLTRRASASNLPPAYVNTIADDRQAMVRAWAAEYCGNGVSFTQTGHKLLIQDHLPNLGQEGWLPKAEPIGFSDDEVKDDAEVTLEAVWDTGGAVCLETPRLAVDDGNIPPVPEAEIDADIIEKCGKRPPRCSEQAWYPGQWTSHGKFRTAVRPAP